MVTKLSFKFETTPFIHCLILFRKFNLKQVTKMLCMRLVIY